MFSYFFKQAASPERAEDFGVPVPRWTYPDYFKTSREAVEKVMVEDRRLAQTERFTAEVEETPRGKMLGGVLLEHIVRVEAERESPRDYTGQSLYLYREDGEMPEPMVSHGIAWINLHLVSGEKMTVASSTLTGAGRAVAAYRDALKTGETQVSEPPAPLPPAGEVR